MSTSFDPSDPRLPAPYDGLTPPLHSVPITVIILAKNEAKNIERAIHTTRWADQQLVIDSGSTDKTTFIARSAGAEVVTTHWRGFGPQRGWALEHPSIRNEWIYFVDADEWVSGALAQELREAVRTTHRVAFSQYFRLVFQGRWIAHSGWYPSSRIIRLMRRDSAAYSPDSNMSEHPHIHGTVGLLKNDLIDDDSKGLAAWLHKHVDYATLEVQRRGDAPARRNSGRKAHEPVLRWFLKGWVAPRTPCRPLVQFAYMYILRRGFQDGRAGLSFCLYHAWFQYVVGDMTRSVARSDDGIRRLKRTRVDDPR